jgi:hypothetical protein
MACRRRLTPDLLAKSAASLDLLGCRKLGIISLSCTESMACKWPFVYKYDPERRPGFSELLSHYDFEPLSWHRQVGDKQSKLFDSRLLDLALVVLLDNTIKTK